MIPDYAPADITRIRTALRSTRRRLGLALGVSARTVEAWETGQSTPSEPARRLLYLFDTAPDVLQLLLPDTPPDLIL